MKHIFLTKDEVIAISEQIQNIQVCLIGDICLDLYWRADMRQSKLSRETPHYPLPVVEEVCSPGAGGNVANNMHCLGVRNLVTISAISNDWRGFLLREWMEQHGLNTKQLQMRNSGVTPCYCKPLRCGISDVVYEDPRIDFENRTPLTIDEENQIINALEDASKACDIIAVADQFCNGVITPRVRDYLSDLAKRIPVVVDSREHITAFRNVIIKPNEVEAAAAAGCDCTGDDISPKEYKQMATALQAITQQPVIVTMGSAGSLWCDGQECVLAPAIPAKAPVDIVGAGDTFLSAFSCAYAACKNGPKALAYANLASAVTVKKIGTTGTASPDEILEKWKEQNCEYS